MLYWRFNLVTDNIFDSTVCYLGLNLKIWATINRYSIFIFKCPFLVRNWNSACLSFEISLQLVCFPLLASNTTFLLSILLQFLTLIIFLYTALFSSQIPLRTELIQFPSYFLFIYSLSASSLYRNDLFISLYLYLNFSVLFRFR